jgi:predicted phage terminase large subunit-like protein
METIRLQPQAGPQTDFLATTADIAIYGGAAGGGKSYGLLIDPLRHFKNKDFGGTIFRRTAVQVRNEGGLWDESVKVYSLFNAKPRESFLEWRFPSGMSMGFAHLEHDKDVANWQGAQIPWIGFDELTHFTMNQFFYMLSRNRSTSGVKPRIRATCNPDPDSWVRQFIDYWIGKDGFPIKERSGKLRWFIRRDDNLIWADTPEAIHKIYGHSDEIQPKSVTFIPALLQDNKILMQKDPGYHANLLALNRVDRLRLLGGNWNVRATAGSMFQRDWIEIIDSIPNGWTKSVRYWDRAATKPNETNPDPDWTRGLKMLAYPNVRNGTQGIKGIWLVTDLRSLRDSPGKVDDLVLNTASHDGHEVAIVGEQDPGSAGVADAENFTKMLGGYIVKIRKPTQNKIVRAKPVSSACENRNIKVLRAPWNEEFFQELENFPDGSHDDIVDVLSGAYNELNVSHSLFDVQ